MSRSILFFVLIACILLSNRSSAQPFFVRNDSIPVKMNGNTILNPWAGGLNFIQASEIDLDLDGIKDLFIFDRTGNKIRTFINKGTANTVDYTYSPQYESRFPSLHDWALLRDYNCDGKEDIFSYSNGGFAVYKNTSSIATGLKFTLFTPLQYSIYNPDPPIGGLINLYISSVDIPSIADIDNDGDLDIITFAITGTYLEYHQNQSMELYGTCDSLKFKMKNRCWGYAAENPANNKFNLHDTCFGNVLNPGITEINSDLRSADRHSGSCEICLDLNGDGAKDIVVGGISYNILTAVMNGGTATSANMISVDTLFPANNASTSPVNITQFPCAYYLDVDNDGKKDLVVSPSEPGESENFNSVVFYKNTGTSDFPVFQFQQSNFLQDNMIDVGEGAYPVFFDYDNDGLTDLFIGNYGYYGSPTYQSQIAQFKNTGTGNDPKFDLVTRDYLNLSSLGKLNLAPAFGDMDGDSDADLITGMVDGKLFYYENTALTGAPANFVTTPITLQNSNNRVIDVGDYATPQIADVDNDGKNDLVIGAQNGKLAYYHHIGSATNSIPDLDSVSHFFGNIKVNQAGYPSGYSFPFLFKQSGNTKLLVGSENGYLRIYDHIDGNLTGAFTLLDSTYLSIYEGTHTSPSAADINADGYLDFVIGNYQGGIAFYKGVSSIISVEDLDNIMHWNMDVYPNPANNTITIHILSNTSSTYKVELYNVMGQLITSQKIINSLITISTEHLKQGIYFCKVQELTNDGKIRSGALTKRIIVQH